jgi:hypothetical protein
MKATRIIKSKNLNQGKYDHLLEQANRLGKIRSMVWNSYGSIKGVAIRSDRIIRDKWIKEKCQFQVLANAWKETLRDSFSDIKAYNEASKKQVRKILYKQISDENERHSFYKKLKSDKWTDDNYLRRLMRKHWKHGRNHTNNQIVVRSDGYTIFQLGGRTWIKIPSLQKGRRIAIPLNTTVKPSGTLRLILRDGIVEVHYTINVEETENCGGATIGIDNCFDGVVLQADENAARNVLARLYDSERIFNIHLFKRLSPSC